MHLFRSALALTLGVTFLSACGQPTSQLTKESAVQSTHATFPVLAVARDHKSLTFTWKGKTHNIKASEFKATILDYHCDNPGGAPTTKALSGDFISIARVNNIPNTPTTNSIAVGVGLAYCMLGGYSAAFVIVPTNTSYSIHLAKAPRIRSGSTFVPGGTQNTTYRLDSIKSVAFAGSGKLLVTHGDASDSVARLVFSNPTAQRPGVGAFERCEVVSPGESGTLCP